MLYVANVSVHKDNVSVMSRGLNPPPAVHMHCYYNMSLASLRIF